MLPTPVRIEDYVWLLERGLPFTVARYGDGEWSCILGRVGRNAQGEDYLPELREALIETLLHPRLTFYGLSPGRKLCREANDWMLHEPGLSPRLRWAPVEVLADANLAGVLGPFIAALGKYQIVLVGPSHLRPLDVLAPVAFVEVPLPNAFLAVDETVARVREAVRKAFRGPWPIVVCWSAGMATAVGMHRVANGIGVTQIDCGAIWDPYVGVQSRKNYRADWFQERMAKNRAEAGL